MYGGAGTEWAQQDGAFPALSLLDLSLTQIAGPLPAFGASGAAQSLQQLLLTGSQFTGAGTWMRMALHTSGRHGDADCWLHVHDGVAE